MTSIELDKLKDQVLDELHDGRLTEKIILLLEEYAKALNNNQTKLKEQPIEMHYSTYSMRDDMYDYNRILDMLTKSNNSNSIKLYNFINTLVNRFNLLLSDEIMQIILSITKYHDDALYCEELTMSNIQALSYACILNSLFRNGFTKDAIIFLKKILNNDVTEELEFNYLCYNLQTKEHDLKQNRIGIVVEAYRNSYIKGNKEATLDNLRKVNIGCDLIGVKFIRSSSDMSFWNSNSREVVLDDLATDNVVYHEVGHFFDTFFGKRDYRIEQQIIARAKEHATRYPGFLDEIRSLNTLIKNSNPSKAYADMLTQKYGESDNAFTAYFNRIKIIIEELGINGINYLLSMNNISENAKKKVLRKVESVKGEQDKERLIDRLTGIFCSARIEDFVKKYQYTFPEFCFCDIVSAIFNGFDININGEKIQVAIGHTKEYYESYKGHYFDEIIAEYNVLKVLGRNDLIDKMRELFGDELLEYLDRAYHEEKVNMKGGVKTNG